MPIKIPDKLPAVSILENEDIFVMHENRAYHQDIRPLKILLFNLMPIKMTTETQFLRLLSNSPIQVEVDFMCTETYNSTNTPKDHLIKFYETFSQLKGKRYDGMIITGAPVEKMEFQEVAYWDELCTIMEWSKSHVFSTIHICWGAQAGLYYHYGIPKYLLPEKLFGIFEHSRTNSKQKKLLRGLDDLFYMPHSRHTEIRKIDIDKVPEVEILAESAAAGPAILSSKNGRQIFITGHGEYDRLTLKYEYDRDISQGLDINIPKNYYPLDDPSKMPQVLWRSTTNILFSNWLNYVYQETPYDLNTLT